MASFYFKKPVPTTGFADAVSVRLLQSDTYNGTYAQVGSDQLLSGLTDKPGDSSKYSITEVLADAAKFTRAVFVAIDGVTGKYGGLEPKVADPTSFQVFGYSRDAGLGIVEGVALDVSPSAGYSSAGQVAVIQRTESTTDAAGRASIDSIPADSGWYNVNFGGHKKQVDSAGLGGTAVNWKDI